MIRCIINMYVSMNVVTGLAGSVFGGGAWDTAPLQYLAK